MPKGEHLKQPSVHLYRLCHDCDPKGGFTPVDGRTQQQQYVYLCVCAGLCAGTPAPKPSEVLNPWVQVPTKPWSMYCTHPYRHLWESYLDRTFWQGTRPRQVRPAQHGVCARCAQQQAAVPKLIAGLRQPYTHRASRRCRRCYHCCWPCCCALLLSAAAVR